MRIDISDILTTVGSDRQINIDEHVESQLTEDTQVTGPVMVSALLTNTGEGIWIKGHIRANLLCECSTCLNPYEQNIIVDFEERFNRVRSVNLSASYEIDEADIYYTYDENNEIDMSAFCRELLILNLPIAGKCDINCKVKNIEQPKQIDPRLHILSKLKSEESNGST